jgi:AcrR family transcriptional regulator
MTSIAPQVRGERLVKKILEVVLEELARVGYGALSIEEVALQAGVNKTTIYRRWPTKAELVQAACLELADEVSVTPDTGTLRGDLFEMLRAYRDLLDTARGLSLTRMVMAEGGDSEVSRLARTVRDSKDVISKRVIARAIARGELPKGSDAELILHMLGGALQHRILFLGERQSDRQLTMMVDLVLNGAANGGARRSQHPPKL